MSTHPAILTRTRRYAPEPRTAPAGETATSKDGVETKLKNLVCAGTATLVDAQNALVDNWQTAVAVVSG